MKAKFLLIAFVSATLTFVSCADEKSKDYSLSIVPNKYSVETLKTMERSLGLNPDASLQLANTQQEVYLVIIDEPKAAVIDSFKDLEVYSEELSVVGNYLNVQMHSFVDGMKLVDQSNPLDLKINGMPAQQVELTAIPPGMDLSIYYNITFVEGKDNLYMFLQWTLNPQRDSYEDIFRTTADSFKELY